MEVAILNEAEIAAIQRIASDYGDKELDDVYYYAYTEPWLLRAKCTMPEIRTAMYRFEAAIRDLYSPIRADLELSQSPVYREMQAALIVEP